jgi:phosphoglycolate phosphatase-like HAD superfamily hydrolase
VSRRPTILLFDIDGTLLHAGGAGRRAVTRVFGDLFRRQAVFDTVRFHGMTDRAIIRGGLERAGLPADEAAIDAICARYLAALAEEMPRSEGFRVHPGVPELLDALRERRGIAVGLGTGNLREGARLKLEHARLFHHFAFGGFGCDHEDRAEIVALAAVRGATQLGVPRTDCRVVVIGDTPRDVDAARSIGADCVAVATSGIDPTTLAGAGATFVFADLATDGVLAAIVDGA